MRRALGLLLLVAGTVVLALIVAQPLIADRQTEQAQTSLADQVPAQPAARGARVPVAWPVGRGEALVVMRVPRFGADWEWVAVEGTQAEQLAEGPGHYAGTPLPGARGNVAFAAHRAGHGDPFIDFDRLRAGDLVLLQQGDVRWTYAIHEGPTIVPASASWVLDPTPGRELTLTTCWPRYGSSRRMYVTASLVGVDCRDERGWHRQPLPAD